MVVVAAILYAGGVRCPRRVHTTPTARVYRFHTRARQITITTQYLEFSLSNEVLSHLMNDTRCAAARVADGQTSRRGVVEHSLRLLKYVLDSNSNDLMSIALQIYLVVETQGTDANAVERAAH